MIQTGGTVAFDASRAVQWSVAPGSLGTISADGIYQAPASIPNKHNIWGCPAFPRNHVFNVRVDALPVHAKSSLWVKAAGGGKVNYISVFSLNIVDGNDPVEDLKFQYTPQNNGPFIIPQPPDIRMQGGYYTPPFGGFDRHILSVSMPDCQFQELYNYYKPGQNPNCANCTSQSGVDYNWDDFDLPHGATDAAGMAISPLTLHLSEVEHALATGGSITHALRFTIRWPADNTFIWPATAAARYMQGDHMPLGARLRLKQDFDINQFTNPATRLLLRQLKEYGLILSDAGYPWQVAAENAPWPAEIKAAFSEVNANIGPDVLEVVDESGLMESKHSGETSTDAEIVIATDSQGNRVERRMILRGVSVGTGRPGVAVQAGASGYQLPVNVTGTENKDLKWSMSPQLGELSESGVYTPPLNVGSVQTTTVTTTSVVDPEQSVNFRIWVIPTGTIRIATGRRDNYTDSQGDVWHGELNDLWEGYTWAYQPSQYDKSVEDVDLYRYAHNSYLDQFFEVQVPDGNYRITAKFAQGEYCSPGAETFHLEAQGQLIYRDVDIYSLAGEKCFTPYDLDLPATVTDGRLQFVIRHVSGEHTYISGLEIRPDSGDPLISMVGQDNREVSIGESVQFYAVGWFIAPDVTWTISPQIGSIDQNGTYTPPLEPVPVDTKITITASSKSSSLKDSKTILLKAGIPSFYINSGGTGLVDQAGRAWSSDRNFSGYSVTFGGSATIEGAPPGEYPIYNSNRYSYGTADFQYSFMLPNGDYDVTLMWADYHAKPLTYNMDVIIQGVKVLDNFDPVTTAGGTQIAYTQTFHPKVTDHMLQIVFDGQGGTYVGGAINGIQIIPVTDKTAVMSPQITEEGIVNGASDAPGIVPGSWATVYGDDLSVVTYILQDSDLQNGYLPQTLSAVSVTIDGQPAYLRYVSPSQISVLVPWAVQPGQVPVKLTNLYGTSNVVTVEARSVDPGIFTAGGYAVAIQAQSGAVVGGADLGASSGDIVSLYGTGLGPASNPVMDGLSFWGANPLPEPATVTVGGQAATVLWSGLVGAGIYQINVILPDLKPGAHPVVLTVAGTDSLPALLRIGNS